MYICYFMFHFKVLVMFITSAGGVLSLLDEPEPKIRAYALNKLNYIVDDFWPEIADSVTNIEKLSEENNFPEKDLASLLVSRVYYHLGAYEDSLTFALGAGRYFDIHDNSEYVETIVAKSLEHYKKLRVKQKEGDTSAVIDPRLEDVVNRMFQRCLDDGQYKQAIGLAIETRRTDIFRQTINSSPSVADLLLYSFKVVLRLVEDRQYRNELLKTVVELHLEQRQPDLISVCQCLIFLDNAEAVAEVLMKQMRKMDDSKLLAYQIAFDLYESATQDFLLRIRSALTAMVPTISAEVGFADAVSKLKDILEGEYTINMYLQFLIRNSKTDMLILKHIRETVRTTVQHNGTVIANGFMCCGTTCDQFLRDNLDWLGRASNWAKFTATASLGVIHRLHEKDVLKLMDSYLPKDNSGGSYAEGGGLYALGLIHANHGHNIIDYLLNQLKNASTSAVQHGACLGIGLAGMGSTRRDVLEQLKETLSLDDAVTGEAAAIAIGLVMVGTQSEEALSLMLSYAHETQHEKIVRGLAVGMALIMYGRMGDADAFIERLKSDKDPIMRWSAMYTIAMAYCGSANSKAMKWLLHVAVSDVNDDVRRTACIALGFLLFRIPDQCPGIMSLLTESYNPHVRCGAAMALGIACAGSGSKEALALLEPILNDSVNYVRQAVFIASAMILIQHNDHTCPKMRTFRDIYTKVVKDRLEDNMAKFGAVLAQGIIDAGGRNCTIGLQTSAGHNNMVAIVGMMVFQQFWFWFPLSHFFSLTLVPTCIIGLNAELKMPQVQFRSAARPSLFAYVPPLEEKKDKRERVETAILSTTAKQKKRDKEKQKHKDDKMDVDEAAAAPKEKPKATTESSGGKVASSSSTAKGKVVKFVPKDTKDESGRDEERAVDSQTKEPKEAKEPNFELLDNPARVMRLQMKLVQLASGCGYAAVKELSRGGIIMLQKADPDKEEKLVELVSAGGPKQEEEGDEPTPPEPFEFKEDMVQ